MQTTAATPAQTAPTLKVRFYQAAARGVKSGIRVAYFTDRAEADAFAAGKKLYARPACVETVEALTTEQLTLANDVAHKPRLSRAARIDALERAEIAWGRRDLAG